MAFKTTTPTALTPDSPEKLILDLPRRKIPDVLPHQKEIMRTYASVAAGAADVALQLPTGSGKTLVGLLIAEWLRRRNRERIVYLCPTRQLVNQVVSQAEEKYGLTVQGFTGRVVGYNPTAKAEYMTAERVAITTYSSLFNTNPFFDSADVIVVDDAHAADGYISDLWSLRIDRQDPELQPLHTALAGVLRKELDPLNFARLMGRSESTSDAAWVDKVPTPTFARLAEELAEVLDAHVANTDLKHSWSMIRENLRACHLYMSTEEVLIRPLIPPTWSHGPFHDARQRIYMSATLGMGGDLERLMGRRHIDRLPVPEGWDRQGVGRRFFVFPDMSLDGEQRTELRRNLMKCTSRSLVLVPTQKMQEDIAVDVAQNLGATVFRADDIEQSKAPYVASHAAVAVVANRYDGIDFPGEECRLLFVEGLPKATNLQERFLMARMGANVLFNERIQVRVLQATGRCTRSLEDYSAVVVSGEELTAYLADIKRRKFLHPELQGEIAFGVAQSRNRSLSDFVENFKIFLDNREGWETVNQQIVALREQARQARFPALEELNAVVRGEVEFQERLWQGDYEAALESAERVLGGLKSAELRGYRAMWHYLAGSAAELGAGIGVSGFAEKARSQFLRAKNAATGIPWLVGLARYHAAEQEPREANAVLMEQIERVERVLAELGTVHDQGFSKREREILEGLRSTEKGPFEHAHERLGELIGFVTGNEETEGSPDPWWIAGGICMVFEDHAGAQKTTVLDVTKARQVASHPSWMIANVEASVGKRVIPVLVTPVKQVKQAAVAHLSDVALWELGAFRLWAADAIAAVREVRRTFVEAGDLAWRAMAAEAFEQGGLDAPGLVSRLTSQSVAERLESVS